MSLSSFSAGMAVIVSGAAVDRKERTTPMWEPPQAIATPGLAQESRSSDGAKGFYQKLRSLARACLQFIGFAQLWIADLDPLETFAPGRGSHHHIVEAGADRPFDRPRQ